MLRTLGQNGDLYVLRSLVCFASAVFVEEGSVHNVRVHGSSLISDKENDRAIIDRSEVGRCGARVTYEALAQSMEFPSLLVASSKPKLSACFLTNHFLHCQY